MDSICQQKKTGNLADHLSFTWDTLMKSTFKKGDGG